MKLIVFRLVNDDTAVVASRTVEGQEILKDGPFTAPNGLDDETKRATLAKSPSSAIVFKKPIDMLGFFGWLAIIKQGMLEPVKVMCIFLGYHEIIMGNKLWRLDEVTLRVVLYINMGFNESGEYKKTFIGFGVGTGSMQVLHGFEFEVEPLGDHTFEVEPQENVNQGAGIEKTLMRLLLQLLQKCSDDSDGYYWEYTPDFVLKFVRDQSGNTLRESQSRFYNGKLVFVDFKYTMGRSITLMSRSIQEAWKKEIWLKGLLIESAIEYKMVKGVKKKLSRQTGRNLNGIQTDNGGEYIAPLMLIGESKEFSFKNTHRDTTVNGLVERIENFWFGTDKDVPYRHLRFFGCKHLCIFLKMKIKLDVKGKPCLGRSTLNAVERALRGRKIPQHNDDLIDLDLGVMMLMHPRKTNIDEGRSLLSFLKPVPDMPPFLPLRRSTRDHHPSTCYFAHEYVLLTNGGEPECYAEAMEDKHKKKS
ncbi:hypothetical protein Tco_1164411 [Tanacetum coccineum]